MTEKADPTAGLICDRIDLPRLEDESGLDDWEYSVEGEPGGVEGCTLIHNGTPLQVLVDTWVVDETVEEGLERVDFPFEDQDPESVELAGAEGRALVDEQLNAVAYVLRLDGRTAVIESSSISDELAAGGLEKAVEAVAQQVAELG